MLAAQVTDNSYKGWQASLALQFCHTLRKPSCTPLITSGRLPFSVHFIPKARPATSICCTRRVVGGDTLDISVRLDAKSHTLITMPGASKFYRSSGPQARLSQHFYLDEGSTLEWLPQDTIIFPGQMPRCAPSST